jgi:hypothetical protein
VALWSKGTVCRASSAKQTETFEFGVIIRKNSWISWGFSQSECKKPVSFLNCSNKVGNRNMYTAYVTLG